MTSHRRFREMLARRVELMPNDERRLRGHLDGCPECRATAAAYEQQLRLLRSLPTLPTPPTLRSSVLNRIHTTPPPAMPWYRRRPSLMPPLAAAAVLALFAVAWIGGSRLTAQHGTQSASSSRTVTPTPKSGEKVQRTQVPLSVAPATPRTDSSKRSVATHPVRQPSHAVRGAAGSTGTRASSQTPSFVAPTSVFGAARFTATPVSFNPSASVAAGIPTGSARPTPIRIAATRPSGRHTSPPRRAASPASLPQPTSPPPTSAPVAVASGPSSATPPPARPPALAPIRSTPSPVAAVQTPIGVVTPVVVNTPMPIVPVTPTPSPIAVVYTGPLAPTPTPTPTAHP